MNRSPSFLSSQQRFQSTRKQAKPASSVTAVTDFLRMHDKMATFLPAITRLAALQKECSAILPALFDTCSVMQFESSQLTVGMPNAALAAKLKQQLPKLQEGLLKRGWQVNAIRIKVQVSKLSEKTSKQKQLVLPSQAMSALASLKESLENSSGNQALKEALARMLKRHDDIK